MTRLVLLVAVLLIAGCQNARYEPKGETDSFGFSSRSVSDRRFSVMFEGDPVTELLQAKDFAMLRAAELTREAGATHFKVIADRSRVKRRVHSALGHATRHRHSSQFSFPEANPPIVRLEYPTAWFEIEIYPDAASAGPDQSGVLNAAETQAALTKKYRLNLEAGPGASGLGEKRTRSG